MKRMDQELEIDIPLRRIPPLGPFVRAKWSGDVPSSFKAIGKFVSPFFLCFHAAALSPGSVAFAVNDFRRVEIIRSIISTPLPPPRASFGRLVLLLPGYVLYIDRSPNIYATGSCVKWKRIIGNNVDGLKFTAVYAQRENIYNNIQRSHTGIWHR